MRKGYFILFVIFTLEMVHTLFAGESRFAMVQFDPFLLFDFSNPEYNLTIEGYAWFLNHRIIVILYAVAVISLPKNRRIVPFSYMVLDVIVFLLHYTTTWGAFFGLLIGLYLIKDLSLLGIIIYEKRASILNAFLISRDHVLFFLDSRSNALEKRTEKNKKTQG